MIQPGLVSVTFKDLPCEEVIRLAQQARLMSIEWHGLDHVPHGDLECARRIGQHTRTAGLAVAAYGSYYVLGQSERKGLAFDTVLQTAKALGAPLIRVWAGHQNPDETSQRDKAHIVDEAKRIADLAAPERIKIVFEFHRDSLTLTGASCASLLGDVAHPNLRSYWQPMPELDVDGNLAELLTVLPWLVGLHVFHWGPTHLDRHPLSQGESDWAQYLAVAERCQGKLSALLEFVKGGTVAQFNEDAATLNRLLVGPPRNNLDF